MNYDLTLMKHDEIALAKVLLTRNASNFILVRSNFTAFAAQLSHLVLKEALGTWFTSQCRSARLARTCRASFFKRST